MHAERVTDRQTIGAAVAPHQQGGYTRRATWNGWRTSASGSAGCSAWTGEPRARDAALLHDLGQISLVEPIPGGAMCSPRRPTRGTSPTRGWIIRHAEGLDTVADYVEAQTTPTARCVSLGEEAPMASRIIKVANAFDDLTGGSDDPDQVRVANERIHLGLGYQYDPEVVEALAVATSDTTRAGSRSAATRSAPASGALTPAGELRGSA